MPSKKLRNLSLVLVLISGLNLRAQDLHIKKHVTVGGYVVSNVDTSIKGARTRDVTQSPAGNTVTIRQCDLKRTLTLNEQAQTYLQTDDPLDTVALRAAAAATGAPAPDETAGKIDVTTIVTDTGERQTLFGYPARHLKSKVVQESSTSACTQIHQTLEIDGWYADLGKGAAVCSTIAPPVSQAQGCKDTVVQHFSGSGKLGYPLSQTITMAGPDGNPTSVTVATSEITKQTLEPELFDVPKEYRKVNSLAELRGASQTSLTTAAGAPPAGQLMPQAAPQGNGGQRGDGAFKATMLAGMLNPAAAPAANLAAQQRAMAQMQMLGMGSTNGMQGMGASQGGTAVAAPQALGPKAAGKIRIGIAPPDAQLGQGSNAGADYSTPIRNAIVALMNGPAVEIVALDAHIPIQLQAEAQQKQCDFILLSSVAVKRGSGGGLGGFLKKAGPMSSMIPMAGMAKGMGGAVAAQAASAAASSAAMSAQQQALSQLAGFNGEIKSKDDVTVQYQLVATGQASPILQNTLKNKAKADGEDVLTPLLQQTANTVLTEVTKK